MNEENPFSDLDEIIPTKPAAIHPECGGDSYYDYSAELYEEIDGTLLWCEKCSKSWIKK